MHKPPNNAINSDVQKRRFAMPLHAGYGERYAPEIKVIREDMTMNVAPQLTVVAPTELCTATECASDCNIAVALIHAPDASLPNFRDMFWHWISRRHGLKGYLEPRLMVDISTTLGVLRITSAQIRSSSTRERGAPPRQSASRRAAFGGGREFSWS
jgi:hypothetical protein